ncbi:MAG TPA: hypothetical protein VOB72_24840 [Candidatus Dormibacteraeota bacterium]|nr:hypothetical protein [Candidatus Dormibacteraeota bacterium]
MIATITGHGHGSRLRTLSAGLPKIMVPVRGVPMVRRLVDELVSAPIDLLVITVPPGDAAVRRLVAGLPSPVEIEVRDALPGGVLHDVCRLLAEPGDHLLVDGDAVLPAGELRRFAAAACDAGRPPYRSLLGVVARPARRDERTIWARPSAGGTVQVTGRGRPGPLALAGCYALAPPLLDGLRAQLARGMRSFGDALVAVSPSVCAAPFLFTAACNVNTAEDLAVAQCIDP